MLERNFICVTLLLAFSLFSPALSVGQETMPAIDPKADTVLKQMSDFMDSVDQFSFHAENATDELQTSGQKLQFSKSVDVFVKRPDRLRANARGDFADREFYYNGKTITLFGKDVNYYASLKAPPQIEGALDHAVMAFDLEVPLADIVYRNSYSLLTESANSGFYAGLHYTDGIECHHLVFSYDDIDVQVWIENSKTPLPRKLIITEKWVTGAPQFTARMSKWDLSPQLKESLFTFVPPDKAEKIEFIPAERTAQKN
jgi:hypothetical protein